MGNSKSKTPPEDQTSAKEDEARRIAAQGRGRRVSVSAEADKSAEPFVPKVIEKTEEQLARIKTAVAKNFLFSGIDEEQAKAIFLSMEEKHVKAGEVVIKQGDTGDFFYVVDSGEFDVTLQKVNDHKTPVFHYVPGGSFGELALMYNCPRAASVTCTHDAVLWVVDRPTFRHIIVDSTRRKREKYEQFLDGVPLLENLNAGEKSQICDSLMPCTFADGEKIITQGEANFDDMRLFFIEEGKAIATITDASGNSVQVGEMTAGNFFGEKALVENVPRAASVIAVGPLKCVAIDIAAFKRLFGDSLDFLKRHISTYKTVEQVKAEASGQ